MEIVFAVTSTALLLFCFFAGKKYGATKAYREGYDNGARVVLKQWKDWMEETKEELK